MAQLIKRLSDSAGCAGEETKRLKTGNNFNLLIEMNEDTNPHEHIYVKAERFKEFENDIYVYEDCSFVLKNVELEWTDWEEEEDRKRYNAQISLDDFEVRSLTVEREDDQNGDAGGNAEVNPAQQETVVDDGEEALAQNPNLVFFTAFSDRDQTNVLAKSFTENANTKRKEQTVDIAEGIDARFEVVTVCPSR